MPSDSRSDLPAPGARRRFARRHPGRTAAALGALLVLGGVAAAGVANAATTYDVRFLGDVSVHDDTTGANCHYHVDEARSGYTPPESLRIVLDVAAPSDACGSVQNVFVDLGSHPGDSISMTAAVGGKHQGEHGFVLAEDGGSFRATGGTQALAPVSSSLYGMTLSVDDMTIAVVPT